MKTKLQITRFAIDTMNQYEIDWAELFPHSESAKKADIIFKGSSIDSETLTKLSNILGLTENEILCCDKEASNKWYKKYNYFKLKNEFDIAENQANYAPGQDLKILINAIFGDNANYIIPKITTSKQEIKERLINYLRELSTYMPNEYHEGEEIINLTVSYESMFSFPYLQEMTASFLQMVETAKNLFFKALREKITDEEINEYNFLVTVLHLNDVIIKKPIYYHLIDLLRPVLLQENYNNFYDYVVLDKHMDYEPWHCKQFVDDKELAEKYFEVFPRSKRKMHEFSMHVSNFVCEFYWSDELENEYDDVSEDELEDELEDAELDDIDEFFADYMSKRGEKSFEEILKEELSSALENYHVVYLPKTKAELGADAEAIKKLKEFSCVSCKGGIEIRHPMQDFDNFLQRADNRLSIVSRDGV